MRLYILAITGKTFAEVPGWAFRDRLGYSVNLRNKKPFQ